MSERRILKVSPANVRPGDHLITDALNGVTQMHVSEIRHDGKRAWSFYCHTGTVHVHTSYGYVLVERDTE